MATVVFDTLKFANRLKDAGFTEQQATIITELQCETVAVTLEQALEDYHLDELATKRDLRELELALKRDVKELELALKRDMKELELALKRDVKELETELKRDMKELEAGLKKDIEILRIETKRDIAEAKAEMVRWVVGVGILQSSLIIGVLLKVAHLI